MIGSLLHSLSAYIHIQRDMENGRELYYHLNSLDRPFQISQITYLSIRFEAVLYLLVIRTVRS